LANANSLQRHYLKNMIACYVYTQLEKGYIQSIISFDSWFLLSYFIIVIFDEMKISTQLLIYIKDSILLKITK